MSGYTHGNTKLNQKGIVHGRMCKQLFTQRFPQDSRFISSKCGDSEPGNLGRLHRMRRKIAKRLDSSPVFAPYLWERGGASTANAERNYFGELNDSDICVVVIDNKVGVTPGVQKEVDQVIQTDKRALFYFVSEFSDASTLLQSQL